MRSTAFVFIVMAIVTSAESSKSFLRRNEIRKAFEFGQVQDFSAKASTRVNILASAAAEIFNLKYKSAYSDAQDKKYQPAKIVLDAANKQNDCDKILEGREFMKPKKVTFNCKKKIPTNDELTEYPFLVISSRRENIIKKFLEGEEAKSLFYDPRLTKDRDVFILVAQREFEAYSTALGALENNLQKQHIFVVGYALEADDSSHDDKQVDEDGKTVTKSQMFGFGLSRFAASTFFHNKFHGKKCWFTDDTFGQLTGLPTQDVAEQLKEVEDLIAKKLRTLVGDKAKKEAIFGFQTKGDYKNGEADLKSGFKKTQAKNDIKIEHEFPKSDGEEGMDKVMLEQMVLQVESNPAFTFFPGFMTSKEDLSYYKLFTQYALSGTQMFKRREPGESEPPCKQCLQPVVDAFAKLEINCADIPGIGECDGAPEHTMTLEQFVTHAKKTKQTDENGGETDKPWGPANEAPETTMSKIVETALFECMKDSEDFKHKVLKPKDMQVHWAGELAAAPEPQAAPESSEQQSHGSPKSKHAPESPKPGSPKSHAQGSPKSHAQGSPKSNAKSHALESPPNLPQAQGASKS